MGGILKMVNWRVVAASAIALVLVLLAHFGFTPPSDGEHASILGLVVREVGFALLVAVLIWLFFEYFNREESEKVWKKRVDDIATNVFFGVLGRNLPKELIQEAHALLLDQVFVRNGFNATYVLVDDTYSRDGVAVTYVRLEAGVRFKVRNIGNAAADFPIRIGLPNPLIAEMKEKVAVNAVTLKRKGRDPESGANADSETKFRAQLADNTKIPAVYEGKTIRLDPDESMEVIWDYVMAKEEEDTELIQTLHASESLTVMVVDKNPDKRIVKARAIHPSPLEDDSSAHVKGSYIFRQTRYLLPHQGFIIWWKKVNNHPEPTAQPKG